jgi:hypothetical protein
MKTLDRLEFMWLFVRIAESWLKALPTAERKNGKSRSVPEETVDRKQQSPS